MTMPEIPRVQVEWKITAGALINTACIVVGFIWAMSAFATKTTAEAADQGRLATELRTHINALDAHVGSNDSRLAALETAIGYIRDSLVRIESVVVKK